MTSHEAEYPHLTDDQLIDAMYCGEDQGHLAICPACRDRLLGLRRNRQTLDSAVLPDPEVSFEALATRRRRIYERLSRPTSVWERFAVPRWISAGATVLALACGLVVYEHSQSTPALDDRISDAQLAQEVSSLSQTPEAFSTEPLKELFE